MLTHRPDWLPPSSVLEGFYGSTVAYPYYRLQLTEYVSRLLPASGPCAIVDVGAGDGYLGAVLETFRPDTSVVGVETHIRRVIKPGFRFVQFDGRRLPFADDSFDVGLLSNVLHHAADPRSLLAEVCRVTRRRVIIKDHLARGRLDDYRLAILDVLGNRRFGASTKGRYLRPAQWDALFASVGAPRVLRYRDLSLRLGLLERVFGNELEIIYALDLDQSPRESAPPASARSGLDA